MALEGTILEPLDDIKYQKHFSPHRAAEIAKNEFALAGGFSTISPGPSVISRTQTETSPSSPAISPS